MMKNKKNFSGMDGFVWWTGIVENRDDPLKLGRAQVRVFGWHTDRKRNDKEEQDGLCGTIDSNKLLWAQPIFAANWSNTTHVPREGDMVFGFFLDGEDAQFPCYFGTIPNIPEKRFFEEKLDYGTKKPKDNNEGSLDPGLSYAPEHNSNVKTDIEKRPKPIHVKDTEGKPKTTIYPAREDLDQPTTSRLARGEDIENTPVILSGAREYGGLEYSEDVVRYPHNSSTQTESGHYFDLDDTQDHERIMLLHRSGSFIEFSANGHIKIFASNNLSFIANNKFYIESRKDNIITVANKSIVSTANTGNISEVASVGNISETSGGNISETAKGNIENKASAIKDKASSVVHDTPTQTTTGAHVDSVGPHYSSGAAAAASAVSKSVSSVESSITAIQKSISELESRIKSLESA